MFGDNVLPATEEKRARELAEKSVWDIWICREIVLSGISPEAEEEVVKQDVVCPTILINIMRPKRGARDSLKCLNSLLSQQT